MKKFSLPKFKIRLKIVLYILLALILVSEFSVVYKVYLSSNTQTLQETQVSLSAPESLLHQRELDSARAWLETRGSLTPLPPYIFSDQAFGRGNPLAEY